MAIILNESHKLNNGYHGFKLLNKGMMAKSYVALTPDGQKVFFKQFSSPSIRVDWYPGFKRYQQEIKARIEDSGAAKFCYKWHEQFEACVLKPDGTKRPGRAFNQTFEFLEGGYDMEKELEKAKGGLEHMSFLDRVISARVMMNAIAAIHRAGVVHTDLKPDNLMLVANDNPHVDAKYDVKLIDMDFAVQVDKTAPWDGKAGYTGTPGWFSPEHKKSQIPLPASDVFTCGLILYQLLAGKQPVETVSEDDYLEFIESKSIPKPTLLGRMGDLEDPGNSLIVEKAIHRCLDPDPTKRPTAAEVNEALNNDEEETEEEDEEENGGGGGGVDPKPVVLGCTDSKAENFNPKATKDDGSCTYPPVHGCTDPKAENYNPEATENDGSCTYLSPGIQGKLLLVDDASVEKLTFGVKTKVGKALLKKFGDDHKFYHSEQYAVAKDPEGFWQVIPDENAPNDTMCNGKKITETVRLEPGDQLAVGREEKGIIKLPLTVQQG
ncbi:MAG: protein kinase [Verrucomicrobiota bacterium]|nr:protein kinase [Verrucomicrobiota bacterium]